MYMLRNNFQELKKTWKYCLLWIIVTTPVFTFVMLSYEMGYVRHYAWWDDAWNAVSSFFGSATENIAQQILGALQNSLEALKQKAIEGWMDVFVWLLGALIFEKHDLYFFALGLLLGLISPGATIVSTLGVLLTLRRIVSGWLSGAEWAAIGVAVALELIPLGEDIAVLPIVWMILTARTTLWLSLGVYVSRFFKETFESKGMFSLLFKLMGFIGFILAIADILGFGIISLVRW